VGFTFEGFREQTQINLNMDDIQVCSNWEDIADNSTALDQQLERLRLEKASAARGDEPRIRILQRNKAEQGGDSRRLDQTRECIQQQSSSIVLDSTREESQRSQYVPPEPRIKLLARPKSNNVGSMNGESSKLKSQQPVKTLEQREKEYKEARMRILGDVQFSDPEEENDGLSPAEVLKKKVAEAMGGEGVEKEEDGKSGEGSSGEGESGENGTATTTTTTKSKKKSRGKKSREKFKTPNIESPREFPLSKADSERIVRQPRGPDGTCGFQNR